jgi:hypothetical protein
VAILSKCTRASRLAACRRHVEQYFGAAAMAAGYERIYRPVQETGGLAFKRRATG